jgi:hypothetical protein
VQALALQHGGALNIGQWLAAYGYQLLSQNSDYLSSKKTSALLIFHKPQAIFHKPQAESHKPLAKSRKPLALPHDTRTNYRAPYN